VLFIAIRHFSEVRLSVTHARYWFHNSLNKQIIQHVDVATYDLSTAAVAPYAKPQAVDKSVSIK
jgi:hypothetical protein